MLVTRDGRHARRTLPAGAAVGTSSLRRRVLLLRARGPTSRVRADPRQRRHAARASSRRAVRRDGAGAGRPAPARASLAAAPSACRRGVPARRRAGDPRRWRRARPTRDALELLRAVDDTDTRVEAEAERALLRAPRRGLPHPGGRARAARRRGASSLTGWWRAATAEDARGTVRGAGDAADALGEKLADELLARGARRAARRDGAARMTSTVMTRDAAAAPGALAGRVVVITRAREQADGLPRAPGGRRAPACWRCPPSPSSRRLVGAAGPRARRRSAAYQWVVFTSVNGVEMVRRRLAARGREMSALGRCRIAAIGPATAQALAAPRAAPPTSCPTSTSPRRSSRGSRRWCARATACCSRAPRETRDRARARARGDGRARGRGAGVPDAAGRGQRRRAPRRAAGRAGRRGDVHQLVDGAPLRRAVPARGARRGSWRRSSSRASGR